jgi:HNH endonuclease
LGITARKQIPPAFDDYRKFKPYLRLDFLYRCAYCTIHEYTWGSSVNFDIDHFRPKKKFIALECVYSNLYYACNRCNRLKWQTWPTDEQMAREERFIDPCAESPTRHYHDDGTGVLKADTSAGGYHIKHIRLNREGLVFLRQTRRGKLIEIREVVRNIRALEQEATPLSDDTRTKTVQMLHRFLRRL